ncbi:MAG: UDP-N-acetylmuramoyl-tripeptide--D-alanyl-D-alanine ligase [Verrucomicrobia bacterium]|nr:UDP-N-acetylmuramoyl-tripeptide--D-alanyl-D-alanine ligase [Verrucomicrobiota bacterium]
MEPRTVGDIVMKCAGEILHGEPGTTVRRVSTDSRQTEPGDLFVALPGDRFDGHEYVKTAVSRGAAAVLVQADRVRQPLPSCPVIQVSSTRRALGQLAANYRREFAIPVVAVAGSNGKTTTKELVAAVLRQRLVTLASAASYNNDIGVPITLLQLDRSHQVAVLEAGTNHPGELPPLLRMIQPQMGVLTRLGREHLEFFGDLDGVVAEEGWLAELLPTDGVLFVDGDSPGIERVLSRTRARVVRVGWQAGNDWRALAATVGADGTVFSVAAPSEVLSGRYRLRLLGRHQVANALLALAVGSEFGLSRAELERGLAAAGPVRMRLQLVDFGGVQVLDDCYNANADSMGAALDTMAELGARGRRVAVLGDMAELGGHSRGAHEEVGRHAARCGVTHLFAVGQMAPVLGAAALGAGMAEVRQFSDAGSAAEAAAGFVRPGDLVLVKASRSVRLEHVVERLRQEGARRSAGAVGG